jgi:hypothetical protein
MANNGIQRKLKAIFSADVQGYSKLMHRAGLPE